MRLDSARELKRDIQFAIVEERIRSGSAPQLAIGVAPTSRPGDYRLAVRSTVDQTDAFREALQARAPGEVDFRVTGRITAAMPINAGVRSALTIGASVAHYRCTAGTLGFFARRLRDGALGIVSNNHVLAAEDQGMDGDDVLHPGPADRGRRPRDIIGKLDGSYPRLDRQDLTVDCAFAVLARSRSYDPSLGGQPIGVPLTLMEGAHIEVFKIGRTTGRTTGRITAFELDDVPIEYSQKTIPLNSQLEIESIDASAFSRSGDSGSLVFAAGAQPVGLLCAASPVGGTSGSGLSYANRIDAVLEALGVTFV
jgi:hypothetical protein